MFVQGKNSETQTASYVYADLLDVELGQTDAASYKIKQCHDVGNLNGVFV